MVTVSKDDVQVPFEMVHFSTTLSPFNKPDKVVVGIFTLPRFAVVMETFVVEKIDHVPVPTAGALAPKVAVEIQTFWLGPAFATEGGCVTVTVNVRVERLLFVALSFTVTVITA